VAIDPEDLPAWSEAFIAADRLARTAGIGRVDRDWAWGGATGRGVRVAIVDSGVERSHPAVRGQLVESVAVRIDKNGDPEVVKDNGQDLYGHATACASIILGLAPEAEIVSVRVLNEELKGKGAAFAEGLAWAIEQGVQVANLSLSSKSDAMYGVFHELADEAYFHNVALVSAANNIAEASYPSLFSSVFSVAAHAEPDPWRFYYNPYPPVEFGAWGVDVPMAWKDGTEVVATGNSFAAPHIAGLVALIISKHPGLTPFELKAILAAVADNPRNDQPPPAPARAGKGKKKGGKRR
jgi:subtilisin family serine protease